MRKTRWISTVAVLLALAGLARAEEFGRLTPQQVDAMRKQKNVFVYDNNDHEQFKKAHVPGATWLNPYEVKPGDLPADKLATLIFYCASEH